MAQDTPQGQNIGQQNPTGDGLGYWDYTVNPAVYRVVSSTNPLPTSGGGGGGSNAAAGANGSTAPTSSSSTGFTNAAGNQVATSPTNPFPQYTAANESIVQTVVNLAAGTSATLIAANAARKSLRWMVLTVNPMTVAPGTGTVTVGQGMNYSGSGGTGQQGGAESFTSDVPTNAFSAISAAGTTVAVWEGQ